MLINRYRALSQPAKRAFWIALLMAVIFSIFASTLLDTLINAPNLQYATVNALPFVMALFALTSVILILSNRVTAGSLLIQAGSLASLLVAVTQADGFGFPAAFILLAVTLYIPVQTLKGKSATAAMWIGFAGVIGIIVLDTFWIGSRVPALAQDTLTAGILSIILSLILIATTISQFTSYTIRTKVLVLAIGTGLFSILSVAIFTTISTQQALTRSTREALLAAAEHTIAEIDTYIAFNTDVIAAEAQLPDVIAFLKSSPEEQARNKYIIYELFNALEQRDPDKISSYALLNSEGIDIADTFSDDVGVDKSDRDYFLQPRRTGRAFVTPVRYSPTSPSYAFYIGVPVRDENGRFLGVLRVRFRASLFNEIIKRNNEFAGEGSYGILLDEHNVIIAHGENPEWVSHTPSQPELSVYSLLLLEGRILNTPIEELSINAPDFGAKLRAITPDKPYFSSTDESWGDPVEVGVARSSKTLFLKVAYVQPQTIAFAPINQQTQITVIVTLITGLIILLAGFFVANTITQPISNLANLAEDITSGNLSARAQYHVQDEVGALANSFNRMTSQLQDTLGGLERRVAERTADLETARLLSERRAHELQSISEISRAISTEQKLEILLPLVTRLVSEGFDFYHVGIFFVDGTRRFAFLQAANSEGGQRMLARGHRLEVGTGLVGTVAQTGRPRIALDVGADAIFFENPDLPDTHSEMALPLNIRGRTIGVMDVQSTKTGAFTEADAHTLGILADQVAIAIETARLFGQTQQAREEAEALYSQVIRQEWGAFSQQESKIGYRQTATGGKPLAKPIETEEIRQARENGQIVVTDGRETRSHSTMAIPVKLHGQVIGVLNIKAPTLNRKWSQEEVNLVQAISDRLALALDNVRLLQESQRRAAKETKISEVSSKIGASINMRNVLQTAVEELGRALPGSEVVIQFQSSQEN